MSKKSSMVPTPTKGSVLPKVLGTVVALAVLSLVIKHPESAATWAEGAGSAVMDVVDGLAVFFQHVAS